MKFPFSKPVSIFAWPLTLCLGAACSGNASNQDASNLNPGALEFQGQERGGGDIKTIRDQVLDSQLESLSAKIRLAFENEYHPSVRAMTLAFLSRAGRMPEGPARDAVLDMVKRGAIQDLQKKVRFSAQPECRDSFDGQTRSATAAMNPTSDDQYLVCVNPSRIAQERGPLIPDAELIGLTVHEIGHFYGYRDEDHSLAAAVTKHLLDETQKIDGESLFHLVPNEIAPADGSANPLGWPTAQKSRDLCSDPNVPKYRALGTAHPDTVFQSTVWILLDRKTGAVMPCFQETVRIAKVKVDGHLAQVTLEVDETKRVPSIYLDPSFSKMSAQTPMTYSTSADYEALVAKSVAPGVALANIQKAAPGARTFKMSYRAKTAASGATDVASTSWSSFVGPSPATGPVLYFQPEANGDSDTPLRTLMRFARRPCDVSTEEELDRLLSRGLTPQKIVEAYYQTGLGESASCSK